MATEHIVGKGELAHQLAARSGLSLKDAEKAVDAFTEVVHENLAQGREVRLIGFGSWSLRDISARTVKSIRTGKEVSLPAHKRVGFSVGSSLAQAAEAPKGKSKTSTKKREGCTNRDRAPSLLPTGNGGPVVVTESPVLLLDMVDNSASPCEQVLCWMIIIGPTEKATFFRRRLSSSSSDGVYTDLLATRHTFPIRLV